MFPLLYALLHFATEIGSRLKLLHNLLCRESSATHLDRRYGKSGHVTVRKAQGKNIGTLTHKCGEGFDARGAAVGLLNIDPAMKVVRLRERHAPNHERHLVDGHLEVIISVR